MSVTQIAPPNTQIALVKNALALGSLTANSILSQPKTQRQADGEKALSVASAVLDRLSAENSYFEQQRRQRQLDPKGISPRPSAYDLIGAAIIDGPAIARTLATA